MDLDGLTIDAVRTALTDGSVTATAMAEQHYVRIEAEDVAASAAAPQGKGINSYLALSKERALTQAAKIDAMAAKGDALPCWLAFPSASRMC